MRPTMLKATLFGLVKTAGLAASVLVATSGISFAQTTGPAVNLTAQPMTAVMPDGQSVPMWGYACGTMSGGATCGRASDLAAASPPKGNWWSPVVITVPVGSNNTASLTVNLMNSLVPNTVDPSVAPTSLVIVGQLSDSMGLPGSATSTASPTHAKQTVTWPVAGSPSSANFVPPAQPPRVQSFDKEVVRGATQTLTWSKLRPGTYLIESGTHPSIQGPMGLYGMLIVTSAPANGTRGTAYRNGTPGAVQYDADVPLLLSEIDPVQNAAVAQAVATKGFSETKPWSGLHGACGDPTSASFNTCYPPVVNYDPRYYLINGVAFDRTNLSGSQFSVSPAKLPASTSTNTPPQVLVRFVNAGLRMHVPSIVGAQIGPNNGNLPAPSGFALIAEDGNPLPGVPKIQNEVFLPAGKTYDVMMNAPAAGAPAFPVFDRQLSLSTNNQRDGGMQGYISINGATAAAASSSTPGAGGSATTAALQQTLVYYFLPNTPLSVTDPAKGVMASSSGVYGVTLAPPPQGPAKQGTVTLNSDGTFTYTPNDATVKSDSFTVQSTSSSTPVQATVKLQVCGAGCLGGAPTARDQSYTSNVATRFQSSAPGVLNGAIDPLGLQLKAALTTKSSNTCPAATPTNDGTGSYNVTGGTVTLNSDGSFVAMPTTGSAKVQFCYTAVNAQKTQSANHAVTVAFQPGSNLQVVVTDAKTGAQINDYRWIIEEDRTFYIDPACQVNNGKRTANCPSPVPSLGTNFHTSYMPVVASGCWGQYACEYGQTVYDPLTQKHVPAVCDIGNGACRAGTQQTQVNPSQVWLDPKKRYYISILPGNAFNPFANGTGAPVSDSSVPGGTRPFDVSRDCKTFDPGASTGSPNVCGNGMGGAPIAAGQTTVKIALQETPLQPAKVTVFVFQDDSPLNGEVDVHGGTDALGSAREPGLGGFEIKLWDDAGGTGDPTGQMSYDMFNMPLSNSLQGTIDPVTGLDACPISTKADAQNNGKGDGLVGMIPTCPNYESDNKTASPLAGQAVIANLMPGRYGIIATPAADRIARGEQWLQTNTLDGQKAHDSFIKVGEPAYFQEFGPAGFHVSIGFANPKIINDRLTGPGGVCASNTTCTNTVTGRITNLHYGRPPNENLFGSVSRKPLGFTQCYVSLGETDGDDIAFTKCDPDGNFTFNGIPDGTWRITVFDQWNDQIVDGLASAFSVKGPNATKALGEIPVLQWHTNLYTRTFIDLHGDGVSHDDDPGVAQVPMNVRYRDGSYSNLGVTDANGFMSFNEVFPLFNWYVVETDTTRYKQTGVHVVYDAGGPVDQPTTFSGSLLPGQTKSTIAAYLANTNETVHLPHNLHFPGSVYCKTADCDKETIQQLNSGTDTPSTGRIDPPWVTTMGWQGFSGQSGFIEFGKTPFDVGENGGIRGEVAYASTRAFDDPTLTVHARWLPNIPNVTVNLYQEGTAKDGSAKLTLVDTTKTASWDDWAQGFRVGDVPNMNCPGQLPGPTSSNPNQPSDPFFFTLRGSREWLNPTTRLAYNSQFKCYDGMHAFNQLQPAPYDGMYQFPSVTQRNPITGAPLRTNCTICGATRGDENGSLVVQNGKVMLPPGKYVVEVVVPPGYELMKEEDKNILIGDNFIAPVTQQFTGFANIYILPDQAAVNSSFNPNNPNNPTVDLGSQTFPRHEGDTGTTETFWPCVGASRIVPDYLSLFPGAQQVAPFAGALRHLCDRKEITLTDQMTAEAKFYLFSSTHVASHFTGFMLDDFSSEFDPFSPQFGEKFAVPNVPVSIKDFAGNEIERVYSDQWGIFNGLTYSTWEVNPPNPTGYAPTMMVACMNDPGPVNNPDPLYNPAYSQFCYEIPFMPGQTQYMDTPVVPVQAFADGYDQPDCAYPDGTPAIKQVLGDTVPGNSSSGSSGQGPWVSQAGHLLKIFALGDQTVVNHAYTGPQATSAPFNQKFIKRHYGFGTTSGSVTIGGVPIKSTDIITWNDGEIDLNVPTLPACPRHNNGEQCGELVITAANGKSSVDTVTVTVGGTMPTYVNGENQTGNAIQQAIDNANPGDMIIVGPGTYNEMLLMWKPVQLQGVGAPSVVMNANTHPAGKLDPWRRQVDCLFGISLSGTIMSSPTEYDPSGTYTCSQAMFHKVDPIPLEPIVGWDNTLNGHLAELLIEPTLMGAYEGAGITVLGKGVHNDAAGQNCIANGTCDPTVMLNSTNDCPNTNSDYVSNYQCNPSRIDGMTFSNSSQGGGGIFLHGWNHYTEVSNNRVTSNAGTLTGGITIGQVEVPDGTIDPVDPTGVRQLAYGYNTNVNVHNNNVTANASIGDEINSTTPSSAGGVTFCTGADYYRFNYNWVCGNISSGDGGGVAHFGFSYNGDLSHNWVLFNQSHNPTLPTYGGGIVAQGVPPDGTFCENSLVDIDCAPELSDGVGPGLVIDGNMIIGNTAESGKGGGLRLQLVNGTEVQRDLATGHSDSTRWYAVTVTNNIIVDNVAGWAGGGVSLQDALRVNFVNNTVVANDATASAGVLFNTDLATQANVGPPDCTTVGADTTCTKITESVYQPAGLETAPHTGNLADVFKSSTQVTCPDGTSTSCRQFSNPVLTNDIFWRNRTFKILVGGPNGNQQVGTGPWTLQNVVTLSPQLAQRTTGFCDSSHAYFWDIGVAGDKAVTNPQPGSSIGTTTAANMLSPTYSILTSGSGYSGSGNISADPQVVRQYCNGSRVPPETGGTANNGIAVPPGIADAVMPNPVFTLQPTATPDEGNNWVNMRYGPLSLVNAAIPGSTVPLGNYSIQSGSPAMGGATATVQQTMSTLAYDFFGTPRVRRQDKNCMIDIGAVEVPGTTNTTCSTK